MMGCWRQGGRERGSVRVVSAYADYFSAVGCDVARCHEVIVNLGRFERIA